MRRRKISASHLSFYLVPKAAARHGTRKRKKEKRKKKRGKAIDTVDQILFLLSYDCMKGKKERKETATKKRRPA